MEELWLKQSWRHEAGFRLVHRARHPDDYCRHHRHAGAWEFGLLITLVVGWSAIFNGVAQIIYGVRTHGGWHVLLEVVLGVIYIIAGIYLLMHPVGGLLALTLLLASFLLIYGIFALVLAFKMRPHNGWGWVLFDAIVTLLLGILIWAHWP